MHSNIFNGSVLLSLSLLLAGVRAQSGGYAGTCTQCSIDGGHALYLDCICGDGKGGKTTPSLALGSCIGNHNGNLVFQHNGGFDGSCKDVGLFGHKMEAHCYTGDGNKVNSASIDLNKYIGNSGGNLVC